MTREKAIYWIATGMVCAVMVFSAINFNRIWLPGQLTEALAG